MVEQNRKFIELLHKCGIKGYNFDVGHYGISFTESAKFMQDIWPNHRHLSDSVIKTDMSTALEKLLGIIVDTTTADAITEESFIADVTNFLTNPDVMPVTAMRLTDAVYESSLSELEHFVTERTIDIVLAYQIKNLFKTARSYMAMSNIDATNFMLYQYLQRAGDVCDGAVVKVSTNSVHSCLHAIKVPGITFVLRDDRSTELYTGYSHTVKDLVCERSEDFPNMLATLLRGKTMDAEELLPYANAIISVAGHKPLVASIHLNTAIISLVTRSKKFAAYIKSNMAAHNTLNNYHGFTALSGFEKKLINGDWHPNRDRFDLVNDSFKELLHGADMYELNDVLRGLSDKNVGRLRDILSKHAIGAGSASAIAMSMRLDEIEKRLGIDPIK